MATNNFTNREIILQFSNGTFLVDGEFACNYILSKLNINRDEIDEGSVDSIMSCLKTLHGRSNTKWREAKGRKSDFEKKNSSWLDKEFEFPRPKIKSKSKGRPLVPFAEKSHESRRKDAAVLSQQSGTTPTRMMSAAAHSARQCGNKDLVAVLTELMKSPERPTKVRRKLFQTSTQQAEKYSAEEALALLLDLSLSKEQYLMLRSSARMKHVNIYPDYNVVRGAKHSCRPPGASVTINDTVATVSLQQLLNHTANRILDLQIEVFQSFMKEKSLNVCQAELICSWGFDGTTGQAMYKQSYSGRQEPFSDQSLFATTLIPLRLNCGCTILWNNRAPQSIRSCRPLRLEFVKETKEHVLKEKAQMDLQIANLRPFEKHLSPDMKIVVQFSIFLTLIDGKILSYLTNTKSMQTCPICHANPKQFNNLANIRTEVFSPEPGSLQYGISPLHAWIRFLEFVLSVSYRLILEPPKTQVRGDIDKNRVSQRKKEIQDRLFKELGGIIIDKPKPGGSGTTNDGNTARRAFRNSTTFSSILGLHPELLNRFHIILIALSCQLPLNPSVFQDYCHATAHLYVENYRFPMSATVHIVLIHSSEILINSVLPVGVLGEEAAEARNRFYRFFREHHARKMSRKMNLEDVFWRCMDTSDPIITNINIKDRLRNRNHLPIPPEVIRMIAVPADLPDNFDESETDADFSGVPEAVSYLDELELSANEDQDE